MDFKSALAQLRGGSTVYRKGWLGGEMWIALSPPSGVLNGPFLYLWTAADNRRVPWIASQADLLAEDWAFAEGSGGPAREPARSDIELAALAAVVAYANRRGSLGVLDAMQTLDEALTAAGIVYDG